ncbi:MAG: GNAT family N-acetyltransferase [Pirellulaceae bacterium]
MELELRTERLRLTPYATTDIDLALEMYTDPDVVKFIGDVMTEEKIRQYMPNTVKRGGNGGIGFWCVQDRQSGEKLGDSYLLPLPIDEDDTDFSLIVMGQMPDADIEIGYFLKPSAWGKGYATEVCERLLQFAFLDVSLEEVVASVDENNAESKNVLEKCGLRYRGITRCYGEDSPIYRITRDEWNDIAN